MTEPTTPLERAQYVAHLMGGNGLSQNQQVELIAAELDKWFAEAFLRGFRDAEGWRDDT